MTRENVKTSIAGAAMLAAIVWAAGLGPEKAAPVAAAGGDTPCYDVVMHPEFPLYRESDGIYKAERPFAVLLDRCAGKSWVMMKDSGSPSGFGWAAVRRH